ncbi:unnamed protein product [Gongylonema pulchrum]|uniref:FACT complex subunit n=1 Tax=Gongylonema pulchrum TaxID=637853 RepID=A0A183DY96_9BILA|nr:unnamed protein product [Gongylonema pulchrum]
MNEKRLSIRKETFLKRADALYTFWHNGYDEALAKVDALVFMVGSDEDAPQYSKSNALQTWLFGFEMSDLLSVFTRKRIYFLSSARKVQFFEPIESEEASGVVPPISLMTRDKVDKDKANFTKFVGILREAGSTFGHFMKDSYNSEFACAWRNALQENGIELSVDVSSSFVHLLSAKDEIEVELCKKAAQATVNTWSHARKKIVNIVDQSKVQQRLADNHSVEACYTPIIQSGGDYTLKLSAESNDKLLHYGTIICSLGARYQGYCSNLSRTMFVDPPKQFEEIYESMLVIENAVIESLKPGRKLCEAYAAGLEVVNGKPELSDRLIKNNFGFLAIFIISSRAAVIVVVCIY